LEDWSLRTVESDFKRRLENDVAENLGAGGFALDGQYGSTIGVDANDPLLLTHTGTNYLYLPGVSGNYASVPDAAPIKLTGDLEIVWRVSSDAWTGGTSQTVVGKWNDGTNQRQYMVRHESAFANVRFYYSTTGANFPYFESNTMPLVNGVAYWFRLTWQASTGTAAFFYAADQPNEPTTWTSAGTPAAVGATTLFNGTAPLQVGSSNDGTATLLAGKVYRSIVRNGVGGTTVFDVDFTTGITSGDALTVPYTGTASTALESVRVMSNLGTGGSVLNASLGGNPTQPTTNDPRLLTHTGTNYLYLPGLSFNDATAPDLAAYTPSTSLDARIAVALDSISGTQALVGHYTVSANNRSWLLMWTTNTLTLYLSVDGVNITIQTSPTIAPTMVAGAVTLLRATWTSSPAEIKFFQKATTESAAAADLAVDTGWTQLGTTIATVSVPSTALFNAVTPLVIGSQSGINNLSGRVYRSQVRVDGSTAFDANFTTGITSGGQTTFTESSSNAATVTINRPTSGRKSVAVVRPVWLFGTDDHMEVPDNDLLDFSASQSFTVLAVVRQWATPTNFGRWIDKKVSGAGQVGWNLVPNATALQVAFDIGDGTTQVYAGAPAFTAGEFVVVSGVVDRGVNQSRVYKGTTSSGTQSTVGLGSLANSLPVRVGGAGGGGGSQDFECYAVAVFRRALSAGEISTINDHYQGTVTPTSTALLSGATFWLDAASSPKPVVSINRSTSGRKTVAVTRPVWLFGTDDLLQVADNALLDFDNSDDWTLLVVNRVWATPYSGQRFIDKTGPAGVGGYLLRAAGVPVGFGGALEFSDGTTSVTYFQLNNRRAGVLDVLFARRRSSTSQVDVGRILNGTLDLNTGSTSTVTGSLANSAPFRIGTNQSAGQGNDFECFAVVAFRRRLSDAELLSIASYYGVTG
jgi:hypothetical protein